MRTAVIGPSGLGGKLGGLLARSGHDVVFAGSRDPEKLARAAEQAGPNARTADVPTAVEDADVVVLAVPFESYPNVADQAGSALQGKIVIDTSNPIVVRDGEVEWLDIPVVLTAAQYQLLQLGDVRLVKAFNLLCASSIEEDARRTGDDRVAVLFVGDDRAGRRTAATLIADAGFVPVDAGGLVDARIIEPASVDDWLQPLTGDEASRLVQDRTAGR